MICPSLGSAIAGGKPTTERVRLKFAVDASLWIAVPKASKGDRSPVGLEGRTMSTGLDKLKIFLKLIVDLFSTFEIIAR